jgi:hypothetical protein
MPNWCSNSIEIVGPRDKIRALWAQAQKDENEGGGLLRGLRSEPNYDETPVAKAYPEIGAQYAKTDEEREAALKNEPTIRSDSWWDWRVTNWGTKWEVSTEGLEFEQDEDGNFTNATGEPYARITGWFDSAWSPPMTACGFYAEANPDVRITLDYHEPGMAFVGRAVYDEGEQTEDDYCDYSGYDSKTVRDAIGAEMDDMWAISENMAEWEAENQEEDA